MAKRLKPVLTFEIKMIYEFDESQIKKHTGQWIFFFLHGEWFVLSDKRLIHSWVLWMWNTNA